MKMRFEIEGVETDTVAIEIDAPEYIALRIYNYLMNYSFGQMHNIHVRFKKE